MLGTRGSDEGYLQLAELIVGSQFDRYRQKLMDFAREKTRKNAFEVLKIETELDTEYYFNLTLGMDVKQMACGIRDECCVSVEELRKAMGIKNKAVNV